MTRTVLLGEPAVWQQEIYELVAAAQQAGWAAARPGAALGDVDAAAGRSFPEPATVSISSTVSGTASAWKSTRRR